MRKSTYTISGLDTHNFQRKIVKIVLPTSFNICFVCSKEPSHGDGSFEHPKHMFKLMGKKILTIYAKKIVNLG